MAKAKHQAMESYIRFDWAAKRLLRQKANFAVLEGFLSVLLEDKIKIVRMLESEGNKESEDDKFNRIDMFAENDHGEMFLIEVQNSRALDFFHRILYGASKAVVEYMTEDDKWVKVPKIYSINIMYFTLGQGNDYLYYGGLDFKGVFEKDQLLLTKRQKEMFSCAKAGELFPEYYILRVNDFDKEAVTPLDEWFHFLKTGMIADDSNTPGLPEARKILKRDKMSKEERSKYDAHLGALSYQKSVIQTSLLEGEDIGIEKGLAIGEAERKRLEAEKDAALAEKDAALKRLAELENQLKIKN